MWAPDSFFEQLYAEQLGLHNHRYDHAWKEDLKRKLLQKLGQFEQVPVPLNPRTLENVDRGSFVQLRVDIITLNRLTMPVYVLIPKLRADDEQRPAVIAVHGHGYGSKEGVGLNPDGTLRTDEGYHKNFAVQLVHRGFIVIAPELIGFGDRKLSKDLNADNSCYTMASQLLLQGKTLAGLRVQEVRRVIDYACSLREVDSSRIGIMGISGGGLVSTFTSILDERLKATVISGYANTFKGSIIPIRHCLDNHIPGILQVAEMPDLIGLIAPRKLFIESGTEDHIFPVEHAAYAISKLSEIYEAFDAKSAFDAHIFEGKHEICGKRSFDWLADALDS